MRDFVSIADLMCEFGSIWQCGSFVREMNFEQLVKKIEDLNLR